MTYSIQPLNNTLIYVTWHRTPSTAEAITYIDKLKQLLDATPNQLYFISDLRQGRIIDIRVIQSLSKLASHASWAGSVAFSSDMISRSFVNIFKNMVIDPNDHNVMFDEFEKARAFLEMLKPGITENIKWEAILAGDFSSVEEDH